MIMGVCFLAIAIPLASMAIWGSRIERRADRNRLAAHEAKLRFQQDMNRIPADQRRWIEDSWKLTVDDEGDPVTRMWRRFVNGDE